MEEETKERLIQAAKNINQDWPYIILIVILFALLLFMAHQTQTEISQAQTECKQQLNDCGCITTEPYQIRYEIGDDLNENIKTNIKINP